MFCSTIERSVTPNEHQDLNNAFAKLLNSISGIIDNYFLQHIEPSTEFRLTLTASVSPSLLATHGPK
jgi:hypothetical protein